MHIIFSSVITSPLTGHTSSCRGFVNNRSNFVNPRYVAVNVDWTNHWWELQKLSNHLVSNAILSKIRKEAADDLCYSFQSFACCWRVIQVARVSLKLELITVKTGFTKFEFLDFSMVSKASHNTQWQLFSGWTGKCP